MLNQDQLQELQDIVGPQWAAADECIRDAYAVWYNSSSLNPEREVWAPRPAAVVMPKTAGEIAKVTQFCNRHDFMIKSFSTGWIASSAAGSRKTILLDLKRMDKIIDIDAKNQIAVIEPYVRAIDLQTELWKQGLNVHVVSCGSNHSVLASAAAAWGYGLSGASMGYSARNLMGLEWVTPTGEIVKFGSAGEGKGWYCMDGPGPGVRGLIRGFHGTFGSLGTFTKCGVKLYRWDGPEKVEHSGKSPRYFLETPLPKTEFFVLTFPSKQNICDAGYQLGEAECNYADFRLPAFFMSMGFTDDNLTLKKIWETGLFQKVVQFALVVCVHGHSQREFEWKVKALKQITKENHGLRIPLLDPPASLLPLLKPLAQVLGNPLALASKIPLIQEMLDAVPIPKQTRKKMQSSMFQLLLRHVNNVQGCFRPSSCMFTSVGSFDTWDLGFEQSDFIAKIKQPAIDQGAIVADGADLGCGGTFESGHLGYLEGIGLFSSHKEESVQAVQEIVEAGAKGAVDNALGLPLGAFGGPMNELFGPHCGDYHLYIKQIKAVLDPHSACDSWAYSGPSEKAFPDEKKSFAMY
ncbi:FAD/FMN-containing dehydrogenase [Desulfatibacillum alkenivorans DSM 16219]|jgi:hypothetical protein|uniref:FAD/FMN-containing dehydrogenase n=1 Tax=Desulfatibacillum alkenivorans DSM 16219 TaxID=1121393 RepID=A0A1M6MGM9_9BACT|nr:FAD-binding oxidoreductase [Desulfatibacillum alkenivorans]SHJ82607.1 FAD/FMN-containing dehydrogenase [Desulfatibacillum alkenivorans DSM 16219]